MRAVQYLFACCLRNRPSGPPSASSAKVRGRAQPTVASLLRSILDGAPGGNSPSQVVSETIDADQ